MNLADALIWDRVVRLGPQARLLILKVDHIGDLMLSLRPLTDLRRARPLDRITLVCATCNVSLARATRLFDEVIEFNYFSRDLKSPLGARAADAERLRSVLEPRKFDLAIDLRHDANTRKLLDQVDARYRIGFEADGLDRPLDLSLPQLDSSASGCLAEARMELLVKAAVATYFPPARHPIHDLIECGRIAPPFGAREYVVVAPASGNALKDWGAHNYALLSRLLNRELALKVVVLGAPSDAAVARIVELALPPGECANLVGHTQMEDLPRVLFHSALFVGNDSGLTHMASLLDVPTVCIFSGVADYHVWRPTGANVISVRAEVPCAPCHLADERSCRNGKICTSRIDALSVFNRIRNESRSAAPEHIA